MKKKVIFNSVKNPENSTMENEIEISSSSSTRNILIRLGGKKIFLDIDTAEELANQLLLDTSRIKEIINSIKNPKE